MEAQILIAFLSVIFILVGAMVFFAYKFGHSDGEVENLKEQEAVKDIARSDDLKKVELVKKLKDEIAKKYD